MRYKLPISDELIDELLPFWTSIFGEELADIDHKAFKGAEDAFNRGVLYLRRQGTQLAGTCLIVQSLSVPGLAGLGEVATDPRFRGRGIAMELCGQAIDEFRAAGGEACFLGTVNPAAARIYHRLGWRKLAGSNVMVNITSGASPEEFLVDYFRKPGIVAVEKADPGVRVPMIPLIVTPHDSKMLDANVGLYSGRYTVQNSCMGLYLRYMHNLKGGQSVCFAARTEDGRVVGLSTARLDGVNTCRIDGFVHHNFASAWSGLFKAICTWAREQKSETLHAVVLVEDEEKQSLFESHGFVRDELGQTFEVAGRSVGSWKLSAPISAVAAETEPE